VMPLRTKPTNGGRGTAADSLGASVLWADLDCRDAAQKEAGLATLHDLPRPPTVIVDSGHGLHAWWALDQFETDVVDICSRSKRIEQDLNAVLPEKPADQVADGARIMRIPGTYNVKDGKPILARIIECRPEHVYTLTDFLEALPSSGVDD